MPPKRKGRVPSRAASSPTGDAAENAAEEPPTSVGAKDTQDVSLPDLWTDEQETSLFKAMIRWKPVGMHKHFRMIAISEYLRSHGFNGYTLPQNNHTTIPGIWEKLGTLYNLEVLDIREDSIENPLQSEDEEIIEPFFEFALPDTYRNSTFARRLASEGSSSPPSLPHQLSSLSLVGGGRSATRHSTVDDTDEPRSSPVSGQGTPSGRSTRTVKGTRSSRLAEVSVPGGGQRGKASLDPGTEDEGDDDAMEIDEEDSKVAAPKDKSKPSKGTATKTSTRRSGRKK